MRTLMYAVALLAFVGLSLFGCADKSLSPVAPTDQPAPLQEPGSLEKCTIIPFTVNLHYPVGILDPGVVKLVGRKWILKDVGVAETLLTTSDLVTGKMIHSLSGILDKNTGEGPVWGTYTLTNAGGGVWEGSYTGYRSKKPGSDTLFTLPLRLLGHGKNGNVQGMKSFINDVITAWGTPPVGWYGSGEGYIKSHGGHH
jgi:hypothetical protein